MFYEEGKARTLMVEVWVKKVSEPKIATAPRLRYIPIS